MSARALRITDDLPRWQIVKEKRATFAATPEQDISGRPQKPRAATCSWLATGSIPACLQPWKARSARVRRRRLWRSSVSPYSRAR